MATSTHDRLADSGSAATRRTAPRPHARLVSWLARGEPLGRPDPVACVVFAFCAVAIAVAAKLSLGSFDGPLLLLGGAIVTSAWYGGAHAGIPATLFAVTAATFLTAAPGAGLEWAGVWSIAIFFGEGLLVTGLCQHARDACQRAVARARTSADELGAGLAALTRLGQAFGAELEQGEVATVAVEGAAGASGGRSAALVFDRAGSAEDPVHAAVGFGDAGTELPLGPETLRSAIGESGVLRVRDVLRDERLRALGLARHGARSVLLARLEGHSGSGVLYVGHPAPDAFDERHERLLSLLAVQTASALDSARHHAAAQRAVQVAQVAERVQDELLSTLSHELRTPLNAIVGWAHLLQGRKLGPDDTHRAIETILRNAALQEGMIGELLDMSSLLNGELRLESAPLDLRRVVEDAFPTAAAYARARNVQLQLTAPPLAVEVCGDARRLQQVVWSLLSNAIKFTPPGGRVRIGVVSLEEHAQIVVSDTGAGMDAEVIARLFSRFARADSSSTRPKRGLGLGLAVARGLVELHGGQLSAESRGAGLGSTFTVRLPSLSQRAEAPVALGSDAAASDRVQGGSAA